jgi:hypothetical protein
MIEPSSKKKLVKPHLMSKLIGKSFGWMSDGEDPKSKL